MRFLPHTHTIFFLILENLILSRIPGWRIRSSAELGRIRGFKNLLISVRASVFFLNKKKLSYFCRKNF